MKRESYKGWKGNDDLNGRIYEVLKFSQRKRQYPVVIYTRFRTEMQYYRYVGNVINYYAHFVGSLSIYIYIYINFEHGRNRRMLFTVANRQIT